MMIVVNYYLYWILDMLFVFTILYSKSSAGLADVDPLHLYSVVKMFVLELFCSQLVALVNY